MDDNYYDQPEMKKLMCENRGMGKLKFSHIMTITAGTLFGAYLVGMWFDLFKWNELVSLLVGSCSCVVLSNIAAHYEWIKEQKEKEG